MTKSIKFAKIFILIRSYLVGFLLFTTTLTISAQNTVGTTFVTPQVADGFTLMSVHNNAFLINNCGEVIKQWNSNYRPGNSVYLLPNGNLLRAGRVPSGSSITMGGAGGIVELFDWDGNLLWSFLYNDDQKRQHHDIYPMPNGNVLILAATFMTGLEAVNAGRDPALIDDSGLYNEQIIEVEPVGTDQGNIVWEWNINDHFVQDIDNTKANFGNISSSFRKLDINFLNGAQYNRNWLHFNSIQYDETLDQIVISCRNLSEVYIIDHSTTTAEAASSSGGVYGHGGDLLYRWGNPEAYQQGTAADRVLYGQHYPHYIEPGLNDAGKILLFNNGFLRIPEFSEVMIIDPPTTSPGVYTKTQDVPFGPTQLDYYYADNSETPSPFFSAIVSGAQSLPNGNTLICEGRTGNVFELDANDNIVWEYINPMGNNTGTVADQGEDRPADNLLFRAIKYPTDYPAFIGKTLLPGNPIEGNPSVSDCYNNLNTRDFTKVNVEVYPNPTQDFLYIKSPIEPTAVSLFDMTGKKINLKYSNDRLNLSVLNSGLYILKLNFNGQVMTRKVLKN